MRRPYPIHTGAIQEQLDRLDNETLGDRVREFIEEAAHGDFDGWESPKARATIERFLQDLALFIENYG